jgi:hypothetical protein
MAAGRWVPVTDRWGHGVSWQATPGWHVSELAQPPAATGAPCARSLGEWVEQPVGPGQREPLHVGAPPFQNWAFSLPHGFW